MPLRLQFISHLFEVILLTMFNFFLVVTFTSFITTLGAIVSLIYSVGKIKRDTDKYHNGKILDYLKYIFTKTKKVEE